MSLPIEDIVAWMGTIAGILLGISPMVLIYKIMKGQENYKIIPESMLILNLLCSELWFCYWLSSTSIYPNIFNIIWFIFSYTFRNNLPILLFR